MVNNISSNSSSPAALARRKSSRPISMCIVSRSSGWVRAYDASHIWSCANLNESPSGRRRPSSTRARRWTSTPSGSSPMLRYSSLMVRSSKREPRHDATRRTHWTSSLCDLIMASMRSTALSAMPSARTASMSHSHRRELAEYWRRRSSYSDLRSWTTNKGLPLVLACRLVDNDCVRWGDRWRVSATRSLTAAQSSSPRWILVTGILASAMSFRVSSRSWLDSLSR
mmetsp:Transcript_18238/g.43184  ORF Transcript_18238/g.43184 Transcript_18238/m.43184 type:complete len:226 (-) Transcript_18238:908-1585(-)